MRIVMVYREASEHRMAVESFIRDFDWTLHFSKIGKSLFTFFLERFKVSHSTPDQEIFYSESDRVHFNANQDLFGFDLGEIIAHGVGSESYEKAKSKLKN